MTHLDQLITVYDSAANMGITCPVAYAAEAQDFFRQHDLFLGEPREESTVPVDEFTANTAQLDDEVSRIHSTRRRSRRDQRVASHIGKGLAGRFDS